MKVRRKYLNDLLIYFQKKYGLYFVEFRQAPNGKHAIVLCHPNNKHWWIHIIMNNIFTIYVTIACTGRDDSYKEEIKRDIYEGKYKNFGEKYIGKWLNL